MTYEFIQAALTNLISFTAIAGFGGIALHAIWTSHCNWMQTYCPPVAPYLALHDPELLPDETEIIVPTLPPLESPNPQPQPESDLWEGAVDTLPSVLPLKPVSRHFSPVLALPQVLEEQSAPKPATKPVAKRGGKPKAQPVSHKRPRTRKTKAA